MSELPPLPSSPPPVPYASYAAGPAVPGVTRPTSVTALAIIGIIWGGIAVLGGVWGVASYFLPFHNPVIDKVKENPGLFVFTVVSGLVGLALAVVLLAGSIGALSLKPWARRAMLFWAWADIFLRIVGTAVSVLWMG